MTVRLAACLARASRYTKTSPAVWCAVGVLYTGIETSAVQTNFGLFTIYLLYIKRAYRLTDSTNRRHVYSDLQPYVCTFEDCEEPDRLFGSRHAWFDHELKHHRRLWVCVEECSRTFRSQPELEHHFQLKHDSLWKSPLRTTAMDACERQFQVDTSDKCPFCGDWLSSRNAVRDHVGRHQTHLSLRALPISDGDTGSSETDVEASAYPVSGGEAQQTLSLDSRKAKDKAKDPRVSESPTFLEDSNPYGIEIQIVGGSASARAILDTASQANLVTERTIKSCGLSDRVVSPGPDLMSLTQNIVTKGVVSLDILIGNSQKPYTASFCVLPSSLQMAIGFDFLLGITTIQEAGLLERHLPLAPVGMAQVAQDRRRHKGERPSKAWLIVPDLNGSSTEGWLGRIIADPSNPHLEICPPLLPLPPISSTVKTDWSSRTLETRSYQVFKRLAPLMGITEPRVKESGTNIVAEMVESRSFWPDMGYIRACTDQLAVAAYFKNRLLSRRSVYLITGIMISLSGDISAGTKKGHPAGTPTVLVPGLTLSGRVDEHEKLFTFDKDTVFAYQLLQIRTNLLGQLEPKDYVKGAVF
jgi:hypothetical protein